MVLMFLVGFCLPKDVGMKARRESMPSSAWALRGSGFAFGFDEDDDLPNDEGKYFAKSLS